MKKYDLPLALLFGSLLLILIEVSFTNKRFLEWAFERHQNPMSWYLRPIFLIPYCYFAYKRSWAGIIGTIFLLLTSMFWFPKPTGVSEDVKQFLQFEEDWLNSQWTLPEIGLFSLVPLLMVVLALTFWKRSLWMGLAVLVGIAIGKISWALLVTGGAGQSTVVPALLGLVICCILVYYGFKRLERRAH
jgi:hypothetical protein